MANLKSAKKRILQNKKKAEINKSLEEAKTSIVEKLILKEKAPKWAKEKASKKK